MQPNNKNTTTILRPFYRDHLSEAVTEENFWTLSSIARAVKISIWLFPATSPQSKQETQLSLRDRATRACQLKSG